MKYILAMIMIVSAGCIQMNPTIEATKSYEGHFYTKEQVQDAVNSMNLQKHESVWILSNTTLKRVLKDCK